jgi:hypothetical protein
MEIEMIDLQAVDSAVVDELQYAAYRRARKAGPDRPLSSFHCLWSEAQVIQFENRYQREAK